MQTWIVLLRAVNVGGTGKLPMAELKALCERAGFTDVRTLIASGNVVLRGAGGEREVKSRLEAALAAHVGQAVGVLVRSPVQLRAVLEDNPFPDSPANRVLAMFLDAPPAGDALDGVRHRTVERLAPGTREIYIDYVDAETMRRSRMVLPVAREGTTRNMNTIARLVAMAQG